MVGIVIASTKFTQGAWMVIAAMPFIVLFFRLVNRHYTQVRAQLSPGRGAGRLRWERTASSWS